jgi:hypothetical protein
MMLREDLERSVETCFALNGIHALSVWSLPGLAAEAIANAVGPRRLPHSVIRATTVGKLRAYGYDVSPSGQPGHMSLQLPSPPADRDWENLEQAFDPPVTNPIGRS